jgi:hypothetical protein
MRARLATSRSTFLQPTLASLPHLGVNALAVRRDPGAAVFRGVIMHRIFAAGSAPDKPDRVLIRAEAEDREGGVSFFLVRYKAFPAAIFPTGFS